MSFKYRYRPTDEAELDVTSFLNLMIVLVPVLLLSLTFAQITVLEIRLPELTGGSGVSPDSQTNLEVVLADEGIKVFYPNNRSLVKDIPLVTQEDGNASYDFATLSLVMQALKKDAALQEKREVLLLSAAEVAYQDLVSAMDAIKSYKTVVVTSPVEIELFPEISLGDAS